MGNHNQLNKSFQSIPVLRKALEDKLLKRLPSIQKTDLMILDFIENLSRWSTNFEADQDNF